MASLHYLVKYLFSKIASTESTVMADQSETMRVHAEENVTAVSELVLSQYDQLQIHRLAH